MKTSQEQFKQALKSADFKATPARLELLDILDKAGKPVSVDEIEPRFKKTNPDKATVYRALKDLQEKGLIRQVAMQHNHAHYELAGQDHHHLICTQCGLVEDIEDCDIEPLVKKAIKKSKQFSQAQEHSFEIFGLCENCNKEA